MLESKTTAAVTRNADVISKTSISSLIGQSEGSFFLDVNINSVAQSTYLFTVSSPSPGSSTSEFYFYIDSSSNLKAELITSGATQCSINFGAAQTGRQKLGFSYSSNNFVFYRNGTLVGSDLSGSIASGFDRAYIGCYSNSLSQSYINVFEARIIPARIPDTQLQYLTAL